MGWLEVGGTSDLHVHILDLKLALMWCLVVKWLQRNMSQCKGSKLHFQQHGLYLLLSNFDNIILL